MNALNSVFQSKKFLVIGDIILDSFIKGKANRLSPEAPVPIVLVDSESIYLGGASNVAANLARLGCEVTLAGIAGKDQDGTTINQLISDYNIVNKVFNCNDFETISKTRVIADDQHIVRYDKEKYFISEECYSNFLLGIEQLTDCYDGIVISDYNKGSITKNLIDILKNKFKDSFFVCDPRPSNIGLYNGFDCITPNWREAQIMCPDQDMEHTCKFILDKLNLKSIVITMSSNGAVYYDSNGCVKYDAYICKSSEIERHHRLDVTGAGDNFIAVYSLCLSCGVPGHICTQLANIAGGIKVSKMGTIGCSFEEFYNELTISGELDNFLYNIKN